jgi:hypothetical protein
VHVHAGNDPAAAPSLPVAAVPICMGLPTQASLDTSNTTMTQKTSNFDAVTAALSGAMATALSGAASAAMSGLLCATFLFGADVAPVHAVSTAQSLQNIDASLVEVTKELKQLSASQVELSAKVDRNQQELKASQLALSAKVDRNQQELKQFSASQLALSAKVDRNQQELSLKIGQVDYKYIWIPIIVSLANIFSRLVESNKPRKPTANYQYLFWGDQNKTAERSAFVGTPKGTLGPAFNHTGADETDDKLT